MRTRFKSNAKALTQNLLDSGKTLAEAAGSVGVAPETLVAAMRRDHKLTLRTASKLRAAFGDSVIRCAQVPNAEIPERYIGIEQAPERRQKVCESLREVIAQMKEMRKLLDADADKKILAVFDETLISVHKLVAYVVTD